MLTGAVNPSGRLPVSLPRTGDAQPYTYLQPLLGGPSEVTATDPTPARPFGFGLSYTQVAYSDLRVDAEVPADGAFCVEVTVTNTGAVDGSEVVQVYGHDLLASVVRPVSQLLAYARVELAAGQSRRVRFTIPTTRLAFSDRRVVRIVEPGDVEVWVGSHSAASASGMPSVSQTNGAINNVGLSVAEPVPGTATPRAVLTVLGPAHEVTTADARQARAEVRDA